MQRPQRPELLHLRSLSSQGAVSRRSPISPPFPGRLESPGLAISPAAVDYFTSQRDPEVRSWRAPINLSCLAGGRVLVALGTGAVFTGSKAEADVFHGLGAAAIVVGILVAAFGIVRFYRDTSQLHANRARFMAAASSLGALMVAAGGLQNGILQPPVPPPGAPPPDSRRPFGPVEPAYESLPLRVLGNFCVFIAIPNGFCASEIVHGNAPIRHRVVTRDLAFATGGAMMMAWAQISSPCPPSPIWARELAQCFGILALALSGALARGDITRAQAQYRAALAQRRASAV